MIRTACYTSGLALALAVCETQPEAGGDPIPVPSPGTASTPAPAPGATAEAENEAEGEPSGDPDDAGQNPELPPQRPAEYGIIKPPTPAPATKDLKFHALAGFEVVPVYSKPDEEAPRLGWLRLGTRLKVAEKVEGPGCPKGWRALEGGGFACGRFLHVAPDKPPYMHNAPPPPSQDKSLPYEYAYVRRWNSPMYWRIPGPDERKKAAELRELREAEREGLPPPGSDPAPAVVREAGDSTVLPELPPPPDVGPPKDQPSPSPSPPAEPELAAEAGLADAAAEEEPDVELPLNLDNPWLEKGFFLSIGAKMTEAGKSWWRTARGGYVEGNAATKYAAKDFQGKVLDEIEYPFGWAMDKPTRVFKLTADNKLRAAGTVDQRTFFDFDEEVEIGGKAYMAATDGRLVRRKDVRIPELRPLPKGLEAWERWIDVSLERQLLMAYEGTKPVFATLVSTGRKGTEEEPFDTPEGRWRIRSKHISTTMDGNTASDGNYSIQDVPWAMYFEGSYALHGAFWHRGFGYRRSHGCVNLGPSDAKWLFFWTTPFLPERWHGVNSSHQAPGTTVIIRP